MPRRFNLLIEVVNSEECSVGIDHGIENNHGIRFKNVVPQNSEDFRDVLLGGVAGIERLGEFGER